jgi:hypothetical protein
VVEMRVFVEQFGWKRIDPAAVVRVGVLTHAQIAIHAYRGGLGRCQQRNAAGITSVQLKP